MIISDDHVLVICTRRPLPTTATAFAAFGARQMRLARIGTFEVAGSTCCRSGCDPYAGISSGPLVNNPTGQAGRSDSTNVLAPRERLKNLDQLEGILPEAKRMSAIGGKRAFTSVGSEAKRKGASVGAALRGTQKKLNCYKGLVLR